MDSPFNPEVFKPAITVGLGPLIISAITFLISVATMSLAELISIENTWGLSLLQLSNGAKFVSLSALSAAMIVFSVAFMGTPGIGKLVVYLIIAFLVSFLLSTLMIHLAAQVGEETGLGILTLQASRIFNFIGLAVLIAAISIPTLDFFAPQLKEELKN